MEIPIVPQRGKEKGGMSSKLSLSSKNKTLSMIWNQNIKSVRNLTAFWLFGLANNFGYVIMLSAAFDLLVTIDKMDSQEEVSVKTNFSRVCNEHSTGIILLADILPSFLIKAIVPFLPLIIHTKMALVVGSSILGHLLVALVHSKIAIIAGVSLISFSCGLGESTLLAYTVFFKTRNVLSTWSSGTGAAGLIGSFAYSGMNQLGLSPSQTILCSISLPVTMALCFWVVLERPKIEKITAELNEMKTAPENIEFISEKPRKFTMQDKLRLAPLILLRYTLAYGLVYFFEYFINQGLYELTQFPHAFLSVPQQYRWYNTLYQLGVFISRSSMNLLKINFIWLLALLQAINVVIFLCESLFGYMSFLAIALVFTTWEGLLGGSAYVNTFRRISTEMPEEQREFSMAINSIGDSVMITLAGFMAIPVHDAICYTRSPYS